MIPNTLGALGGSHGIAIFRISKPHEPFMILGLYNNKTIRLKEVMQKIAVAVNNKDSASCGSSNSDDDNKKPKAITSTTTEKPMSTTKLLEYSIPSTTIQHPKYHDYSKITIEDNEKRIIQI